MLSYIDSSIRVVEREEIEKGKGENGAILLATKQGKKGKKGE